MESDEKMAIIEVNKQKKIVGYNRVSTIQQNLEANREKLIKAGATKIFEEKKSGTKKNGRKELSNMLKFIKKNKDKYEIEILVVKIDRLARSILDLRTIVDEILENNAKITFLEQNLVFDSKNKDDAMPKMMLNFLGMFAELERDMIVSRTKAGLEFQKENNPNFKNGRRRKLSDEKIDFAIELLETKSATQVAEILGISRRTLFNYVNARKAEESS